MATESNGPKVSIRLPAVFAAELDRLRSALSRGGVKVSRAAVAKAAMLKGAPLVAAEVFDPQPPRAA